MPMKLRMLVFFGAYATALTACKREKASCPDPSTRYKYIKAADKGILPYSGKDTLRFKTKAGSTLVYYGEGSDTLFNVQNTYASPDCPANQILSIQRPISSGATRGDCG
jgi:hypothetical protein